MRRKKTFTQPDGIPNYKLGPIYDTAGASRFIYLQEFANPLENISGTGSVPVRSFRVTQPPQLYVTPNVIRSGIGLQHGNFVLQPLSSGDYTG